MHSDKTVQRKEPVIRVDEIYKNGTFAQDGIANSKTADL